MEKISCGQHITPRCFKECYFGMVLYLNCFCKLQAEVKYKYPTQKHYRKQCDANRALAQKKVKDATRGLIFFSGKRQNYVFYSDSFFFSLNNNFLLTIVITDGNVIEQNRTLLTEHNYMILKTSTLQVLNTYENNNKNITMKQ